MTGTIVLALISLGAVAFLVRVFIAFCKESRRGACHIVHISQYPGQQGRRSWTVPFREMPRPFAVVRGVHSVSPLEGRVLSRRGYTGKRQA